VQLPRIDVTRIKEGRLPNKADLDEAAPNNPTVYTWQYANRNIQILNDAAIKAAKISKATVAPKGCTLHFTPNGEFTGKMESCQSLLNIPRARGHRSSVSGQPGGADEEVQRGRHHEHRRAQQQRRGLPRLSATEGAGRLPLRVRVTIRIGTGDNSRPPSSASSPGLA
jgi:predicted amidohydrolase YtcJ